MNSIHQVIAEEMQYKPKDPNEPSMDIDTMRRLAMSLILLRYNCFFCHGLLHGKEAKFNEMTSTSFDP